MIKINGEELHKQLEAFAAKFRSTLEKGVERFAYKTADILIQSTPYGNVDKYLELYEDRQERYGFDIAPGLAKGSWLLSTGQPVFIQEVAYDNKYGSKSQARSYASAQEYMLGETIYLTNSVPYIEHLEKGYSREQAPEGIMELSLNKLQRLYGLNVAKILTGEKK